MNRLIITAGFAMFSMFFGSGNLVFPLLTGVLSGESFSYASIGLGLTGVIVPFLGLLAIIYYQGNRTLFFRPLGRIPSFLLIFAMLALMGPFGVIPRCIIVAYGGMHLIWPDFTFWHFSIIFCIMMLALVWRHSSLIHIIGNYLTPIFIAAVILLIGAGLFHTQDTPIQHILPHTGFVTGICQGYQTMDLLAAFFFSSTTIIYITSKVTNNDQHQVESLSLRAALLGAGLLGIIYIGLVYLGAKFATDLQTVAPESMIVEIGRLTLGEYALPVVAIIILLACLTTAAVLAELFADFLRNDCCHQKISRPFTLIITILASFAISLIGFKELARWISLCLTIVYPALLVYVITTLISHKFPHHFKKPHWFFWGVLIICLATEMFIFPA